MIKVSKQITTSVRALLHRRTVRPVLSCEMASMGAPEKPVDVTLPFQRVLSQDCVAAATADIPENTPIVLWLHSGTRGFGAFSCTDVSKQLVALRCRPDDVAINTPTLHFLIQAIDRYEPGLVRMIHALVPPEPMEPAVGNSAFQDCKALSTVDLPLVMTLGDSAFKGCSNLTTMVIPDSVRVIGHSVFSGCAKFSALSIPASVVSVGGRKSCCHWDRPGSAITDAQKAFGHEFHVA